MKMQSESDVAVAGKTKRILAFDLIRGFFLLVILIDHVELYPNGWDFFTGKGRLWVSAAEGFFFLSGLLIGMIYKRRLALGMKFIFRKMWTRAAELYIAGVGLTFLFLTWVEFTHHAPIKEGLLMRFTYGWADFLVRFAILMLIAPLVFYLVAKGKWWLALIGMLIAWKLRGQGFTWSWQIIFNSGIIIGFYWQRLERGYNSLKPQSQRLLRRSVAIAAVATFTISYASVYVLSLLYHLWGDGVLPGWLQHVAFSWGWINHDIWNHADKWTMGPLRILLFFLWAPTLYIIFRRYEQPIGRYSRGILEMLGSNSLFVYTTHAFIIFTLKMYFIPPTTNFFQNFLITGVGLVTLISISLLYVRVLRPKFSKVWWPRLKLRLKNA